jgi:ATP-dependent Lon protease
MEIVMDPHQDICAIDVSYKTFGDYYGFTLDGNHRYMLGDFTVTHNTTLVKHGICKSLGLPFGFVPLGGISDGSFLLGHSYTYEGSRWGRIVDILMTCGAMNPILFFDELDKISNTHHGDEIKNILIHLTDATQNMDFHDKYFSDLSLDLSRALMIFSFNDGSVIDPILKDRMITIKTNGYSTKDKVAIVNQHLLQEVCQKYGLQNDDIMMSDTVIQLIISRTDDEQGVRNLKRSLDNIVSRLNFDRLTSEEHIISFPYRVTEDDVHKLVPHKKKDNVSTSMMYI